MHVWLRRQEIEVARTKVIAQGLLDPQFVQKALKEFIGTVHPWLRSKGVEDDKKMIEAVEKEVAQGPIAFHTISQNILRTASERFNVTDDFRKKLAASADRRRALGAGRKVEP